jgi:hypothetical protein
MVVIRSLALLLGGVASVQAIGTALGYGSGVSCVAQSKFVLKYGVIRSHDRRRKRGCRNPYIHCPAALVALR